jgi:hypothetical protein
MIIIIGWACIVVGLLTYLLAFAKGPGPTMGDQPEVAGSYTIATALMILGFVLVAVI